MSTWPIEADQQRRGRMAKVAQAMLDDTMLGDPTRMPLALSEGLLELYNRTSALANTLSRDFDFDFELDIDLDGVQWMMREQLQELLRLHQLPDFEPCDCPLLDQCLRALFGMGSCLCKDARQRRKTRRREQREERRRRTALPTRMPISSDVDDNTESLRRHLAMTNYHTYTDETLDSDVKFLIIQTLQVIRTLVNNEQEPPRSLMKLNLIADKEKGWLLVVKGLIESIPHEDSLGPAVISLFLDECPLPSKETVHKMLMRLQLNEECAKRASQPQNWLRNACIVLGSLAEKMAGIAAVAMFNDSVQDFLVACITHHAKIVSDKVIELGENHAWIEGSVEGNRLHVVLFAMLALEKFAQTSENQRQICRMFESLPEHPLRVLEKWVTDPTYACNWLGQQVGFCAQWSLDNIFVTETRTFAYESADVSNINAMLNHADVSEYLKIGPDGLEARCDVSSFESVRCTFEVLDGVWYYEAIVLTPGVMQIGLATKRSRFLNHEGYGIGDDESSVAYDGCRQLVWHNAVSHIHEHRPWSPGDVVGVLLSIPDGFVQFSLNGIPLKQPHTEFLENRLESEGVFAAASFMSFQQCRFNFGSTPFRFPPRRAFFKFNDCGSLTTEQKTIMPRKHRLEILMRETVPEDFCTICYAAPGKMQLLPCLHRGFCETCAIQLEQCPMCRAAIEERCRNESFSFSSKDKRSAEAIPASASRSASASFGLGGGDFQRHLASRKSSTQPVETVIAIRDDGDGRRHTQV